MLIKDHKAKKKLVKEETQKLEKTQNTTKVPNIVSEEDLRKFQAKKLESDQQRERENTLRQQAVQRIEQKKLAQEQEKLADEIKESAKTSKAKRNMSQEHKKKTDT